jgi:hypothetical protein
MTRQRALFVLMVVLLTFASLCFGKYSGGTGEPNDPYLIATAEDMNEIGANPDDWDAHFVMVNDINLADYAGTQFNIIGTQSNPFTGVFDGNDHKIWNFSFSCFGRSYIGLFTYVRSEGQIMNLGMENIDVNVVNGGYVAGLVGYNRGLISNCYVTGTVTESYSTGELVEENKASNYSLTTSISSYYHFGGLVGYNLYDGMISNCYVIGCVSGTGFYIGGLVGTNDGTISNCYAVGAVSGKNDTAGLVGHNCHGTISNCYATGEVSGDRHTGGLVGHNCFGTISNCYATETVDGNDYTGGLVGDSGGTVSASFWDIESGGPDNGIGTPLPTEQMQIESTFTDAGWDFIEIWNIGEHQTYPFLRIHPAGDINHDDIVNFFDLAILADHWLQSSNLVNYSN